MKTVLLIAINLCSLALAAGKGDDPLAGLQVPERKAPVAFTENKGQVSDQFFHPRRDVLFSGTAEGMTYHLRTAGISYQLSRTDRQPAASEIGESGEQPAGLNDRTFIYRLDIDWISANPKAVIETDEVLPGYDNYYLEVCPEGALQVKTFTGMSYKNIYNGIDLHYYQKDGHLKYDYLVAAGTDYKQIQMEISGAESLVLNKQGDLLLKTPMGTITEQAPVVIQNGKTLAAKWVIKNKVLSFDIEGLDPMQAFIIDPAVRAWGTYYGDINYDEARGCAADGSGNVYLAGYTNGATGNVIATTGSHQTTLNGGQDAFLAKFDNTGQRLWATLYGGAGSETAYGCAADAGNVFITGMTSSATSNAVASAGSHQTVYGGGMFDAYLVKFNAAGVRQWGTYYGGSADDQGYACVTNAFGDVYLAGRTSSGGGTVIATAGSHQSAYSGGGDDAFLVQFSSSGQRQWGTYYGGTVTDIGRSCATDAIGNVYLTGITNSSSGTVIATAAGHQLVFGGTYDAFLVKFNVMGVRQWGTYYGDTGTENAYSCATDASGNVFMSGATDLSMTNVISTVGSHQPVFGGLYDAFLVKFNPNGVRQWGTYYGAPGNDYGYGCSVDAMGNSYLAGITGTSVGTVIATPGSHQTALAGGSDAFLAKFDPSGVRQWGSYYGGTGTDVGYACAAGANGKAYLAGRTDQASANDVASLGAHQTAFGGVSDAFLAQIFECASPAAPVNTTPPSNLVVCENNFTTLFASGTGTLSWYAGPTATLVLGTGATYITPALSAGSYTYYVETLDCIPSASRTAVTVNVSTCTGLDPLQASAIAPSVYPNPGHGEYNIRLQQDGSAQLVIYNLAGMTVFSATVNSRLSTVNISSQPAGIYFIEIKQAESLTRTKLIRQ